MADYSLRNIVSTVNSAVNDRVRPFAGRPRALGVLLRASCIGLPAAAEKAYDGGREWSGESGQTLSDRSNDPIGRNIVGAWEAIMAGARTSILTAASLGIAGLLFGTAAAAADGHRHHAKSRVVIEAAYPNVDRFTYRINPYAGYVWYAPGVSIGIGTWGSQPTYFPLAGIWSRSGNPADLACNMPSSPCWNQDRQ